jgi:hypothetical protein
MTAGDHVTGTPVDLTASETWRVLRDVLGPLVAQGAIVRRPRATAWAERRQVDRTARRLLDGLCALPARRRAHPTLAGLDLAVGRARYLADDPLPPTMDHLGLRFGLRTDVRRGEVATAAA